MKKYSVTGSNEIFKNKELKTFKTYEQAKAYTEKANTKKNWNDLRIWEVLL